MSFERVPDMNVGIVKPEDRVSWVLRSSDAIYTVVIDFNGVFTVPSDTTMAWVNDKLVIDLRKDEN